MRRRRGRGSIAAGVTVVAVLAVAAASFAAPGDSDGALSCPGGTTAMVQQATYDRTQDIEGFDSPEEAVDHLVTKAYPGMPRGRFERASASRAEAVLRSDAARATVVELDRLVPNAERTRLVSTEHGTAWVVEEFAICESDARRWAAR